MIASGIRENGGLDAACPAAKLKIEPHVVSYYIISIPWHIQPFQKSSRQQLMMLSYCFQMLSLIVTVLSLLSNETNLQNGQVRCIPFYIQDWNSGPVALHSAPYLNAVLWLFLHHLFVGKQSHTFSSDVLLSCKNS